MANNNRRTPRRTILLTIAINVTDGLRAINHYGIARRGVNRRNYLNMRIE